MLYSTRVIVYASVALAQTATCAAPTAAQSVAEFYKGKTRVIVCASVALAQTATCAAPTAAWHG